MNESRSFADLSWVGANPPTPLIDTRDTHHLARREDFPLGNATIRPSVRTVEGPSGCVTAEPRVMQVLLALSDAGGSVVTREDLIHQCWKGQVVGDDSVNRAIKEVRRIARACDAGFEIETIPRIGYRLNDKAAAAASPHAGTEQGGLEARGLAHRFSRRSVIAASAVAGAGLAGTWALWRSGTASADPVTALIEQSRTAMRAGTPENERKAIALLEQAIGIDPGRADAWGQLALIRARIDEHVIDDTAAPLHAVTEAAEKALRIDPDNADAKAALVLAVPYYGQWSKAHRQFAAFHEDHPDHVYTRDAHSFFLAAVGRIRDSASERLVFLADAPLDANIHFRTIYSYWFEGRIDEADRATMRGLEMWPRHSGHWFARLWVLASTGRVDRALAHVADTAMRPPLPGPLFETLTLALSAMQPGNAHLKDEAVERIMGSVRHSVAAVVNAFMLLNLLGRMDEAFALSDAYFLEDGPVIAAMQWRPGQPVVPDQRRRKTNMLFTPTAARMREDPRFLPLTQRMGLVAYWEGHGITPDFLA